MGKDLRFGIRMLLKSPGFTVMAVLTLALGIGANTAIFSVINAVMLQRMPFATPERLAMVWEQSPRSGRINVVNPVNFLQWRARNHSFERIAALIGFDASLAGMGEPEVVHAMAVSDGFFPILSVKPRLGRWFTPDEDFPGKNHVAIISEGLWSRRFGGDPDVVGRHIRVNNTDSIIVGVMPAGFRFPKTKADLWRPLAIDPAQQTGRYLMTVARLRDGETIESAQADMNVLTPQLQRERPDFNSKWGITVVALREWAVGEVRMPLLVLLAAVGLVLLVACANVANLLLMRAASRRREIAVRVALGAGAARIVRQLLVESTLLGLAGGAAGLALGLWATEALAAALPDTIRSVNLETIRIDSTVFLFATAISFATGVLFGLAPAFKAIRTDVQTSLKDGGRGVSPARSFARNALVVVEVALSMILLVGAGLLIRSFSKLASVNPGFDAQHVISMRLSEAGKYDEKTSVEFNRQVLERVRAVPGVAAAGMSHFLPLSGLMSATGFWRADQPRPAHGEEPVTEVLVVMPGFFAAMNIPLIRGRVFDERDRSGAPNRVVINQTLANRFFPNEDPVGKVLTIQWGSEPYEIVGVVGDVRNRTLNAAPQPCVYVSNLQDPIAGGYLVARATGDPRQLVNAIRAEIRTLDRDLPLAEVKTMDEYVSSSVAAPRFNTILLGGFAALAVALAAVGIFGVISYSVTQRTRELGIRRALGADASDVVRLVLAHGGNLAACGIAIGAAGAIAATRLLRSLLYEVTPTDVTTFIAVAFLLACVAIAASYLPARRAATIDPAGALRYE
jgi:putative ABC transport system permease protein